MDSGEESHRGQLGSMEGKCGYCTLFALDLRERPQKFKKYQFFTWGSWEHLDRNGTTRLGIGALEKCHFSSN